MELVFTAIILVFAILFIFFMQKNSKQRECELKEEITNITAEKNALQQLQAEDIRQITETKTQLQAKEDFLSVLQQEKRALTLSRDAMQQSNIEQIGQIAQLKAELSAKIDLLGAQQDNLLKTKEELNKDFQLLANKILEDKSIRFTDVNKANIEAILKPLNERLVEFRTKVEETYDKESQQRFSLEKQIKELVAANSQISADANNLTKALKGNSKTQGNWGEMILDTILEKSGLKKGEEYVTQEFIKDIDGNIIKNAEDAKMQPDVIVKYPDGRKIVIDAKTSLTAYVKYIDAESDEIKLLAEKEHLISIKKHIDELSLKSYQDYVESLDFVMMFVPNESAYMVAMQLDPSLWDYAYRKRILLISPTNLITSLKLVYDLWQRDTQSRNAEEIAKTGGALYDKFVGFVETLDELGQSIHKSQKTYDKAYSQLKEGKGNLIRRVEVLKELGAKAQKQLPNVSE